MITATTWVPRGHAAAFPTKYVFDEDEYARISKLAKLELDDAKEDLEDARNAMSNGNGKVTAGEGNVDEAAGKTKQEEGDIDLQDNDLKEYDLEHYDDPAEVADGDVEMPTESNSMFGNIKSLAYHTSNAEDPYITLQENEASDDEERDELQILPIDNLVLAARIEDEVAHLEVYVYEDEADNLYVHHDIMLPAIPLCVEWLDTKVSGKTGETSGGKGNFVAVGTMDPDIELWDLDTVDCMYPNAILGQSSQPQEPAVASATKPKKKKKKSKKANDAYHVDSVLALAANRQHKNLLASASADKTLKLWDLTTCTAAHSYSHHTDKVCALSWHLTQSSVLLSGSYDRTVVAADMRAPDAKVPRWGVESDVEQVKWDPHDENQFYVSTENGVLHCFDARTLPTSPEQSKAVWRLQAHEKSLSSFSLNPAIPGYIATGGTDRTVKLWNTTGGSGGPSMVVSRDLGVGKVFSAQFAPDEEVAFRLAVAGSKGAVQVWDTSTNKAVREAFAGRVKMGEAKEERVVGVEDDESESDDDEEEEEEEGGVEANGAGGGWESMDED